MAQSPAADLTRRLALALEPCGIGLAARELVIAHAGLESGWGRSTAAAGRNFWNLTAGSHWPGAVIGGADVEYDDAGHVKPIRQAFRAYASDYDACRDYLAFVGPGTRYSRAWPCLNAGNAAEYARELRSAGFFTAPLAEYRQGLAGALATVRRLLAPPEPVA